MNIIINVVNIFEAQLQLQVAFKVLRAISRIEYCNLIRPLKLLNIHNNIEMNNNDCCQIEYQDYEKILWGEYDINWNEVKPLDEKLINQMSQCESAFLEMIGRFELLYGKLSSYKERKKMYLNHLRYWNWILDKNSIDLFLSFEVPNQGYDFVIYSLCQLKKIKTLYFYHLPIDGTLLLIEDWQNPAKEIKEIYKQIQETKTEEQETNPQISLRFKHHYERQVNSSSDPIPFYMKEEKLINKFIKYINTSIILNSRDKKFFIFQKLLAPQYWLYWLLNKLKLLQLLIAEIRMFKFYESQASEPELSQKYIYLPLHYQPEATTSPLAGVFVNQLLIVQLLAYAIPEDFFIYVKEHPKQTGFCRSLEFYKSLLNIPKVKLVPRNYNSFRLIENCVAVATATGTAGWEALFRKKPVLMFGHHFYQHAYGVFQISSLEDCQTAINQIINKEVNLELEHISMFLKALEKIAILGYVDPDNREVSGISEEENIENLSTALISKIRSYEEKRSAD